MGDIRSIAGGAIRQAVHDMEEAHDKLKQWETLDREGTLRDYAREKLRQHNTEVITFTLTDATAVDFFNNGEDANDKHHLLFDITGIKGLPGLVREQKAYIERNHSRLRAKMRALVKAVRREMADEKEGII